MWKAGTNKIKITKTANLENDVEGRRVTKIKENIKENREKLLNIEGGRAGTTGRAPVNKI